MYDGRPASYTDAKKTYRILKEIIIIVIIYKCAAGEITGSIHDTTIKHLDGGSRAILAEVME